MIVPSYAEIYVKLIVLQKTEAEWILENPVLKSGEIAYSVDENNIKIGNRIR